MTDLFAAVRERVPVRDAAVRYGFEPDRAGKICCAFHGEKTPSLQLYPGTRGWYCFGCGQGGSVIDFAMRLFHLSAKEAAEKLCQDFGLDVPRQEEREQPLQPRNVRGEFEAWRDRMANRLAQALYVANAALRDGEPWTDQQAEAVRCQAALEYWRDALASRNMAEQMEVFRDRKGVSWICSRILTNTPAKSSAV